LGKKKRAGIELLFPRLRKKEQGKEKVHKARKQSKRNRNRKTVPEEGRCKKKKKNTTPQKTIGK